MILYACRRIDNLPAETFMELFSGVLRLAGEHRHKIGTPGRRSCALRRALGLASSKHHEHGGNDHRVSPLSLLLGCFVLSEKGPFVMRLPEQDPEHD
ncbi:hypothetical protein [Sphingomonas sp. 3-13AW]|uniref:hypothetical protein n=1 Tax=Sphingomonas sp. 3-13AW TaxID=3050450 RepID=UPI003BB77619